MFDLWKSELRRFLAPALIVALVHLLVLRLLMAVAPLFSPSATKTAVATLVYAVVGFSFGLYQLGTLRKSGPWTFLVHRPLGPSRICAAILGSGVFLLTLITVLPLEIIAGYSDLSSPMWVDSRHYWFALFVGGVVLAFYFLAAFVTLCGSGWALLAGSLVFFFLTRHAVGSWVFLPMVIVLTILCLLAYASFRPNLGDPLRKPWALGLAGFSVGYAVFWILVVGIFTAHSTGLIFWENGLAGFSTFSWDNHFPDGTVEHLDYLSPRDRMIHGLRSDGGTGDARAEQLRDEIAIAEVYDLTRSRINRNPVRYQLMFADMNQVLRDSDNEVLWTFSHDRMLFQGLDIRSGEEIGWLGRQGLVPNVSTNATVEHRFLDVPRVLEGNHFMTRRRIYDVDFRGGAAVDLRFELPPGEEFTSRPETYRSMTVVLSNLRLYFFRSRDFDRKARQVQPVETLDIPKEGPSITGIQIAELIDSYLVSWVLAGVSDEEFEPPQQRVVEVRLGGEIERVAQRALTRGFPPWLNYRGYWISPFLQIAHDQLWSTINPIRVQGEIGPSLQQKATVQQLLGHPEATEVVLLAFTIILVVGILTIWLSRKRGLDRRETWAWTLFAASLGIPGFFFFLTSTRRRESVGLDALLDEKRKVSLDLRLKADSGMKLV